MCLSGCELAVRKTATHMSNEYIFAWLPGVRRSSSVWA